jgi:hypothetical protein
MQSVRQGIAAAIVFFALIPELHAGLIRYEFTGTMSTIRAEAPDRTTDVSAQFAALLPFAAGDPFTGHLVYDTAVPDVSPDPETGIYDQALPDGSLTWDIGGARFTSGGGLDIRVLDRDATTGDLFVANHGVVYGNAGLGAPLLPAGLMVTRSGTGALSTADFGLQLFDRSDRTALTSDALPNPLEFPEFDFGSVSFSTGGGSTFRPHSVVTPLGSLEIGSILLSGQIDSLRVVPVPEPSAAALLLAVLVVTRGRPGRSRRRVLR